MIWLHDKLQKGIAAVALPGTHPGEQRQQKGSSKLGSDGLQRTHQGQAL